MGEAEEGLDAVLSTLEEVGDRAGRIARLARLPFVPSALEWLHVGRTSVVMDTSKAKSQLGWTPKYTAAETLSGLTEAV